MNIDFSSLSANQRYHLLTQTVVPRPIAWVLSENEDHSYNLAPYSFFNALCSEPAILVMSVGSKEVGTKKDTAVNCLSGRNFVVHIASVGQAESLTATSATLAYGVSEVKASQLPLTEFDQHGIHRLRDCDVAFYCKLYDHHELGPNQQTIIYAEVLNLYVSDAVATVSGKRISVDAEKLNPLARLGAAQYAGLSQSFTVTRPD